MFEDQIVRTLTPDRAFRIIAVTASNTLATLLERQGRRGPGSAATTEAERGQLEALGRLLLGACLLRHATAPDRRVQFIFNSPRSAVAATSLVVDVLADGTARGLIKPAGAVDGEHGTLQVLYSARGGDLHRGIVSVQGEESIDDALMRYLQESEQIIATLATEVEVSAERVVARGYLAQVLPDAAPEALTQMIERLAVPSSPFFAATSDPSPLSLACSVAGARPELIAEQALRFGCGCSVERVLASLETLPLADRRELAEQVDPLEVTCEACGVAYRLATEALASLASGIA